MALQVAGATPRCSIIKKMTTTISRYLKVLGIVQLIGLNIGGIFWLFWADGIRKRKKSSRNWVLAAHSCYLALSGFIIFRLIVEPDTMGHLYFYKSEIEVPLLAAWGFVLFLTVIYGLPMYWLLRRDTKREFIEQAAAPNP
jgi:cbb3-type cytochrome oxidase subunit 3